MNVLVTIPWREEKQRVKWLEAVKRHYKTHFPTWDVFTCDSDPAKPFNRSQARNNCVAVAIARKADVVIVNDADTMVKSGALRQAVDKAADTGKLIIPFETCLVYSGHTANTFVDNVQFPAAGGFASTGGCYVVRPESWIQFGASDVDFIGWGGEDDYVATVAGEIVGIDRVPGVAISLGHTAERTTNPHYHANMKRVGFVRLARGKGAHVMMAQTRNVTASLKQCAELSPIAVIAPSRGRPENIKRLWESMVATCIYKPVLIVGVDEDDPFCRAYHALATADRKGLEVVTVSGRHKLNWWWNYLAELYGDAYEAMLFAGDDNKIVTPAWDALICEELRSHNNAGFATGPDGLRKDRKFTWAAMSTRQTRAIGYVGPAELRHLCIDTAWQYLADATGTMWWRDDILIEHLHYTRTDAGVAKDATYTEANSSETHRHDHQAVDKWRDSPEFAKACRVIEGMTAERISFTQKLPTSGVSMKVRISVGDCVIKELDITLSDDELLAKVGALLCK